MKIDLRVIPNAKHQKIINVEGVLKVYITAPAVEGKANKALLKTLASHFKVKVHQIQIIKGLKSRQKTIMIEN